MTPTDAADENSQPPEGSESMPTNSPGATPQRPVPRLPSTPRVVPPAPQRTPVTGEAPSSLVDTLVDALAAELGVSRDSITVVTAEAVIWNDGSLGCPKPGEFYTQALVPGYHVILEANGTSYDYRASESGYFFLCTSPRPGIRGTPGIGPVGTPDS